MNLIAGLSSREDSDRDPDEESPGSSPPNFGVGFLGVVGLACGIASFPIGGWAFAFVALGAVAGIAIVFAFRPQLAIFNVVLFVSGLLGMVAILSATDGEESATTTLALTVATAGLAALQGQRTHGPAGATLVLLASVVYGEHRGLSVITGIITMMLFLLSIYHPSSNKRLRWASKAQQPSIRWAPLGAMMVALAVVVGLVITPFTPAYSVGGESQWGGGDLGGPFGSGHPGLRGGLDAGDQLTLSDDVVLRVKSDVPMYWRGTTYDSYDGRYWQNTIGTEPFQFSDGASKLASGESAAGTTEVRQVFTLVKGGVDVILGADRVRTVYMEGGRVQWRKVDNTIELEKPLNAGATWTVISSVRRPSESELRESDGSNISQAIKQFATENDISVETTRLANEIMGNQPTTYDKVRSLEAWFDNNIEYSRLVPSAPAGVDPVDRILFDVKKGYCEQIASAMAVMLRSQGVPARIAVGYVPGEFDDSTGEWLSKASDAHAWVEVYFPGVGWQAFDPTSSVELADEAETEGGALSGGWSLLRTIVLIALLFGLIGLGWLAMPFIRDRLSRRSDPNRWIEDMGESLDLTWSPGHTLGERMDDLGAAGVSPEVVADVRYAVEERAYGPADYDDQEMKELIASLSKAVDERVAELASEAHR